MNPPLSSKGVSGIGIVSPLIDAQWDERVAALPGATFFHGKAWAQVLHSAYGFTPTYFSRDESLLPAMEIDSWATGRRGVGLPFTDECAPLAPNGERFSALLDSALSHAQKRRWKYLECRGGREFFGEVAPSTSYFGHRLDLTAHEAALFAGLSPAARRAVRKSEQSGLTIETSQGMDALQDFFGLFCLTRKRHGLPVQPFRFFAEIHRHVLAQNHGCVVLARLGPTPVAGAVFVHFGRTVIYKFGASNEEFQHLRANNLVMWESIKGHARQGFKLLDFGRTSLANEGLRQFKLGWGTREHSIDYYRYDLRASRYVTVPDGAAGWYTRLFTHLPVSVSRLAGSMLYRHAA